MKRVKMGLRHSWESNVSGGGLHHRLRTDLFEAMTQTSTILVLEGSGVLPRDSGIVSGSRAVVVVVEEEDASAVGQETRLRTVDICRVVELSILPPAPAPPSNAVLNKVFFRFVSLFICDFTATNFVSCYST